jgi:hypothetical protein
MTKLVLFKGGFDPWHRPDQTGFSKTGYVTATEMVIHPCRSRIARTPLKKIVQKPHRFIDMPKHPHSAQIEEFFTSNVLNNELYVKGLLEIPNKNSNFWNNPIKVPILAPITPEEHELRWNRTIRLLQKGDGIFTFDAKSISSRAIAYLDQGSWSHIGTYSGNGLICEAITSGVVERSIEAYRDSRYRLGVYRLLGGSSEQIDRTAAFMRSQVGKLRLGMRLALGIWPANRRRDTIPNMLIAITGYELVALV